MKLGTTRKGLETMYPSATKGDDKDEVIHQTISLPLKLLKDIKVKKGDKICVEIEGSITGIHDDEYSSSFTMKAEEGECTKGGDEAKEGEEPGTILGGEGKE